MYRIEYNLVQHSCLHFATVNNIIWIHITRRFCYFAQIYFCINIRSRSLSVRGPKLWNCLPLNIQNEASLGIFKHRVVDLYISTYWSILTTLFIYFWFNRGKGGGAVAYYQHFLYNINVIIFYLFECYVFIGCINVTFFFFVLQFTFFSN